MSIPTYQFVVLTSAQFDYLKDELGWDIGAPRVGPDGRLLTNRNGNVPFSDEELLTLAELEVETIWSDEIFDWLTENGWE